MLQQTRVDTVMPYFERFLARFPTPLALAEAPEDQVLAAWSGLGYYRRARMLHAGARLVADRAHMPRDREGLLELPGIGRYTAGAIASIAFDEAVGLVDGNVARVLARIFALDDDMRRAGMKRAEALAEELVPAKKPGDWNQALMELGATICTPRSPACDRCPVASSCRARAEGRVDELPVMGEKAKPKPQRVQALVARTKDGRVLLARRRSSGLFAGLWEPPSIDGDEGAQRATSSGGSRSRLARSPGASPTCSRTAVSWSTCTPVSSRSGPPARRFPTPTRRSSYSPTLRSTVSASRSSRERSSTLPATQRRAPARSSRDPRREGRSEEEGRASQEKVELDVVLALDNHEGVSSRRVVAGER